MHERRNDPYVRLRTPVTTLARYDCDLNQETRWLKLRVIDTFIWTILEDESRARVCIFKDTGKNPLPKTLEQSLAKSDQWQLEIFCESGVSSSE